MSLFCVVFAVLQTKLIFYLVHASYLHFVKYWDENIADNND